MSADLREADREARIARLAVAGILGELLDFTPFESVRAARLATPEQLVAIRRAASWPVRSQAAEGVRHHVGRIVGFTRSPRLRVVG